MSQPANASGYRNQHGTEIATPSDAILRLYRSAYGDHSLATGISLLNRLRGKIWRTGGGEELTVEQMTASHASNLIKWLERRARIVLLALRLEAEMQEADHDGGQHAHDDLEREVDRLRGADPLEELRRLPLYQAIAARRNVL